MLKVTKKMCLSIHQTSFLASKKSFKLTKMSYQT